MKVLKPVVLVISFLGIFSNAYSQKNTFEIHTIGFYNLENLFDTINNPNTLDELSPIMELKGNRAQAYHSKIKNMARAIADIGNEATQNAPVILGVCEVENRNVLEDLIGDSQLAKYRYGIIHFESPDARGIDVGLLYQKSFFTPTKTATYTLRVYDDLNRGKISTRDQLVVSGKLRGDAIHIIVNHWPSRRGGETRSAAKRIAAAKLNKRIVDSLQTQNPYAKIIIMGDLNDNPTNKSLKSVLNTQNNRNRVTFKGLYNPFENFYKNGLGTTAYRDQWSLFDQIIVSKPLLDKDYTSFNYYKAAIFNKNYLVNTYGKYKGYPYRSWNASGFSNGFSDHFPVYIYLIKTLN